MTINHSILCLYKKRALNIPIILIQIANYYIRCTRDGVSLHNGGQIKGSPCTPQYDDPRGIRGGLNEVPMMPRDASLSDSYTPDRCCYSSLDLVI